MYFILKKVNKCCCCLRVDLRTGTLILLWIGIIYPCITLLNFLLSGISHIRAFADGNSAAVTVGIEIVMWFFIVQVILLQFVPQALALYGVHKNKPDYLRPYIFLSMVGLLFCALFFIIFALSWVIVAYNSVRLEKEFKKAATESYQQGADANLGIMGVTAIQIFLFVSTITIAIAAGISYYFASVVNSQYLRMKEESNKHFGSTVQYDAYDSQMNFKDQLKV